MKTIDRADWHYEGDFPEDLPEENGGTHIGMYLNWLIDRDMVAMEHFDSYLEEVEKVRGGEMSGRDFFFDYCDGKFLSFYLKEEALAFTKSYYLGPSENFMGHYYDDFNTVLAASYESLYEVPNTRKNYVLISATLDAKFEAWKKNPSAQKASDVTGKKEKKFWQVWKS